MSREEAEEFENMQQLVSDNPFSAHSALLCFSEQASSASFLLSGSSVSQPLGER
jgi:hypothetical protein